AHHHGHDNQHRIGSKIPDDPRTAPQPDYPMDPSPTTGDTEWHSGLPLSPVPLTEELDRTWICPTNREAGSRPPLRAETMRLSTSVKECHGVHGQFVCALPGARFLAAPVLPPVCAIQFPSRSRTIF